MVGARARWVPPTAAVVIALGGGLVLAGWILDIPFLKQPMSDATPMQATTAVAFVSAGVSLWFFSRRVMLGLATALGVALGILGVLSFGHVVFGPQFPIDQLWLSDPVHRMSPLTAINLALIGSALACSRRRDGAYLAQYLVLLALLVATIVGIGYIYRVSNLVALGPYTSVAPHSVGLLIMAAVGVLFLHPDAGFLEVVTGDTLGGRMARRILPASIGIPILLGWVRLWGERAGAYDPKLGPPLVVVGSMILISLVVWRNAQTIARLDEQRKLVDDDLRRANESLETRVAERTAQLVESRARADESAEMFFRLFEYAPDALLAVTKDGRIERANARATEVFGYGREDMIGRQIDVLIPARALTDPPRHDLHAVRSDGRAFPVDVVLSPVESPHGTLVVVVHDLTERRRTERLTRAAEERLRTGQRMEALGQLAGGVAHDFNNMMTVVTGYSDLMLTQVNQEHPFYKGLSEIRKAGDRCANLTGHLLAFSRRQVLTPAVLDMGEIVADLSEMLPVLLGENVAVTVDVQPTLGRVRADRAQIEQVIVNLIVNARDAMPEGGRLTLSVRDVEIDEATAASHPGMTPGSFVRTSVADTGHGMDDETRARAFDPFFTTKPVGQGSGLGLSTAYGFIQQSGGLIYLESAVGRGTAVEVYLPRVEAEEAVVPSLLERPAPRGQETILVAEDEAAVRGLVRDVLEGAGYRLLDADCGAAALEIESSHRGPIHLLLSDVVMPGMSGPELAERFVSARRDARVLLISGYSQNIELGDVAMRAGVAFLSKPFTPAELLHRVRETLDA